MVSNNVNVQVCHHPQSTHIMAEGQRGNWVSFGNEEVYKAAKKFAVTISAEMMDEPLRLLVRYEHRPEVLYDVTVHLTLQYSVVDTYPERNAIDYQMPN